MKKHAIIPIFIPHKGCPNDCVFCNQRKITARTEDVTANDARQIIDTWLTTLRPAAGRMVSYNSSAGAFESSNADAGDCSRITARDYSAETVEASFYGGSFTGLEIEEQSAYLSVAYEYKQKGFIDKIHLSTRPDYIDREILDNLRKYSVDTIELGVQSFDDEVLRLSNRGHSSKDVYNAVELLKEYGFEFGIQLMIGLPGDTLGSCIMSAQKTAELEPSLARLYPTIVLDDTRLYEMYISGEYKALSREEAILRTKEMYKILDNAGITIMRVGLKSTDIIGEGGAINGGTYHPAFRQLVEGEIAKERIEPRLIEISKNMIDPSSPSAADQSAAASPKTKIIISSNSRWYSNMIGHKACNRRYFEASYPQFSFSWKTDDRLPDGRFSLMLT